MSEKLYVLGHPVSHSKSPVMYNAVYEKAGLPWHYGLMDVPTVPEAETFLAARDFLSINITTPYKPEAFAAADVRAASATLAHGANVLVNKDGALIAYNTDGQGCVAYLERAGVDFRGASVVVCGTGPTSLSILHAVAQAGPAEVVLIGRDKEKARNVMRTYADELGAMIGRVVDMPAFKEGHLSFSEVYKQVGFKFGSYATSRQAIAGADIIIDATPLGMKAGDPAPFDTALLSAGQTVFDVVYGHGETALARAARAAGCTFLDGAGMLVGQAVVTVGILRDIAGEEALDIPEDELFRLMAQAAELERALFRRLGCPHPVGGAAASCYHSRIGKRHSLERSRHNEPHENRPALRRCRCIRWEGRHGRRLGQVGPRYEELRLCHRERRQLL